MSRLNRYQINVYNHQHEQVAVLDDTLLRSLSYEISLNDQSPLALSFRGDHAAATLIQRDYILDVWRYNYTLRQWAQEHAYIVSSKEFFGDDDSTEYCLIGGKSLEHLLWRRVINPADDPLAANGYSTKGGAAETVMHDYVKEQIGPLASAARRLDRFVMGDNWGRGRTVGWRKNYTSKLLGVCRDTARRGLIDFRVLYINQHFVFTTGYFGRQRTVDNSASDYFAYSKERGNLTDPRLKQDWSKEENYCYLIREGQGDNRVVLPVYTTAAEATPLARAEFSKSLNRDEATALEDVNEAYADLYKKRSIIELDFDSLSGDDYNVAWMLGDEGTAQYRDYSRPLRIMRVKVSISGNEEKITPTLEDNQWEGE